jgi:carbon-monoxide dehydrogenase large subunit
VERITVKHGDTDEVATGGGTMGSRSLQAGGVAVHEVAVLTVERAKSVAADLLEAAEGDIQLDKDRGVFHVAGSPDEVKSWPEVAAAAAAKEGTERGLVVEGSFTAQGATFPFGAHLAVVEVDTGTGRVDLTRVVSVDDAGKIVNPIAAEGQRHGGIAQGAAQALLEEMRYDPDGNPVTGNFADYGFITADLLPSFELVDMATPTTINPLGVKGIGESGTIGATPAVQNAVIDAVAHLGIRHIDMPTTSEKVWRAIQEGAAR